MMLGFQLRPGRTAPAGAVASSTAAQALFRNGEQGVIYDPSDLSTLWQDSAGTTPVTAAGQPVGLMLDKSGGGNHAFIATAASRPILRQNATTGAYYLETDGSDDWMQTNAIDFTGTDKVTVMAGVRKLSDAAGGAAAFEFSENASVVNGAFAVFAPSAGTQVYAFRQRGTLASLATSAPRPAPSSVVITCIGDISNDMALLRVSGVQTSTSADQGTGNYGNHPLYLFRRAGTSLPFSGHFYGLTIVGRLTTDTETRNVERLYANKTGVVLS